MKTLMTTAEVARRLGVKRETVYAYVSRGLLVRDPASEYRRSLFDPVAVEALAGRARRLDASDALEVRVRTELTSIDPDGRLFFRGHDVVELAKHRSFEDVAGLLWDGDPGAPWELTATDQTMLAGVRAQLPGDVHGANLIALAVATLGATDPQAADRRPEAVRRAASRICAGAVYVLGPVIPGPSARPATHSGWVSSGFAAPGSAASTSSATTAERLWHALAGEDANPTPRRTAAVNAALVVMADHELSSSALASRIAASAWADPYRVVLAGLGPLGGVLHGAASHSIGALLAEITSPVDAAAALDRRLAAGPLPGFGLRVYRDRDPRCDHLLERIPAVALDPGRARLVDALTDAAADLGLPAPNVDFGLAALAYAMGLRRDAPSTIFTVSRISGLIAHALEEYPHRLRFRPRATYVGPAPRG